MKGAKDVFYKTLNWAGAKIRATCYRPGTGTAVSLAMSTIHHGPLFDLNMSFPKDHKWYFNPAVLQDERNAKAFPVVAGSSDHHDVIKGLPISPLTLVQGDTVWFIMRQFSLTSSTVDKCISSRCREITQDHALRESYETVLKAVDRMNLLPRRSDYNDARRNNNNNTNLRGRGGRTALDTIIGGDSDSDSSDDEEELPGMDWPSNWIRRVNEGEVDLFKARLNSDNMDDSIIRGIIDKHDNGKSTGSISSLKKKLIAWSDLPSYLYRKYFFYNVQQLKERILELDGQATVTGKNKDALFDLVVKCERKRIGRNTTLNNNQDPYDDDEDEDTLDPVLLDIFKASKMKPLGEEAKKYCRAGHLLERPFLEQFHQHSIEGRTCGYKSIAIHETPVGMYLYYLVSVICLDPIQLPFHSLIFLIYLFVLFNSNIHTVESTSLMGALDSSDAELIYKKEDDDDSDDDSDAALELMPIEIKARVAHTTFYSERLLLEANLGLAAYENGEPVYAEIDAEGGDLHKWIPKHKESFQLLHHVAVRNARKGLFLVGNKKKLMFGVFVTYSDDLINSYRALLKDLFDRALKPFYQDDIQLPQDKIEKILQAKEMKKLGMTYHSFQTDYYIWRQLRIEKVLQLPIPPCNRILPYNHSVWNNLKGASDTATKLMWNCQIKFASSGRSQLVASAKFFQLYSIILHREYQVATSKTDLNFYASLHHFRNTRNQNYPFHKTLDTLSVWFIKNADDAVAVAAAAAAAPPPPPPPVLTINTGPLVCTPPRIARSNPRSSFQEIRNYTTITGGTPGKGRAKNPKNKTSEWEEDQNRLQNCNGILYYTKQRNKCCICGGNSNMVCVGCKRWYCCKNQDEKLKDMITNSNDRVAFMDGERPPSELVMNGVAADGITTAKFCVVDNGCFHMWHRQSISQRINILDGSNSFPALVSPMAAEE
jgi:hypothetical protein